MKKNILVFILLFILSLPAVNSLLQPGSYASHDLNYHIGRVIDMDKLLAEGQFPPRWSGDLNLGYGYPLFLFIYPTPAIFGAMMHRLGMNFVDSVKWVMIISILMGVFGMYLFLKELFNKHKLASILGSMFYVYAPVTFVNLYVSAEVGTIVAMGILPFVFWSIVAHQNKNRQSLPIGAVSLAILITSHNITALIFAPVILIFSLILVLQSNDKLELSKHILSILILGVGLSAFFWFPAIIERKYILYDVIMKNFWLKRFADFWQIIIPSWGYGLSYPSTKDSVSHQIGVVHIAIFTLLLVVTPFLRKNRKFLTWSLFVILFSLIGFYLMQSISRPIWETLPLLYLVQFPPRFLILIIFSLSIGTALLIKYLPFNKVMFIILLISIIWANWGYLSTNKKIDVSDNYSIFLNDSTTAFNEHLPRWAYVPENPSNDKIIILNGSGTVSVVKNTSVDVVANIDMPLDGQIRFNQFYFPGWKYTIDGKPVEYSYSSSHENRGLPLFNIASGRHEFIAIFEDTLDRKISDLISEISLIVLLGLTIFGCVQKNKYGGP